MESPPSEYNAIIGDSKLLCVLTSAGEIRRLFWPHIDYGQHFEQFRIGLQVRGHSGVLWLGGRGWAHSQSYREGTNVVLTQSNNRRARVSASAEAFAVPGADSLVLRYKILNRANKARDIRLGVYEVLRINESPFYNAALFDEKSGSLVFYLRDIVIATRSSAKIAGYQCGVAGEDSSALKGTKGWNLAGSSIQHKNPDGAVAWSLGLLGPGQEAALTLYMSAGTTIREAIERSEELGRIDAEPSLIAGGAGAGTARGEAARGTAEPYSTAGVTAASVTPLLRAVESTWKDWLSSDDGGGHERDGGDEDRGGGRQPQGTGSSLVESLRPNLKARGIVNRPVHPDLVKKLGKKGGEIYERSLLTLKLLADRQTGAITAAPEFDREREACGGYGYCWGRDGAFNAYALGLAGMLEEAEAFFEFAQRVQELDGVWLHRHYSTGELAPSWGLLQIDETGAIIWAAHEHFKMTGSRRFLNGMWDSISRGATYLAGSIDEETGLPLPSFELWEEQLCESVYSAAAVAGGFRAAAACAAELGKRAEARAWTGLADRMREAIARVLWDPKSKSFLKSVKKSMSKAEFTRGMAASASDFYVELADGQLYPEFIQPRDPTTDSSLLGLAFPFQVLDPSDKMMTRAAAAVARRLWSPKVGGIMRYESDHYVGGNPWILTTLWLAIYYLEAGMTAKAIRLIKWAIDHATDVGLLTEQVDKRTGKPIWAVPLGWSHAMYVIAVLKLAGR